MQLCTKALKLCTKNDCMDIKRKVSFFLQKTYTGNDGEYQIRLRIRWGKELAQFNVGYNIDPKKWDKDNQRCKKNATNKKGYSSSEINKEIQRLEDIVQDVFKSYEVNENIPTSKDFTYSFNTLNGKKVGIFKEKTFEIIFLEFCREQGKMNTWSDSTYKKLSTLKNHLLQFNPNLKISQIDNKMLVNIVDYFISDCGMQNTTVLKCIKNLKWFLRWAEKNNYISCRDYVEFSPKLKIVYDKEIIFLTWEELMRVYNFQFPETKQYIERARDVFCFQCFTSLRFSDVSKLKKIDVTEDSINVVTQKTYNTLKIDLNKYSKSILDKYKDIELDNDKALPVVSNQKSNAYIKEFCRLAEINTPIKRTYYQGSERIEEVFPKYELIGTHSGRKTFICNALALGIPASTVMEWTGHSDYKAMKPYIAVANDEKKKSMDLFNKKE